MVISFKKNWYTNNCLKKKFAKFARESMIPPTRNKRIYKQRNCFTQKHWKHSRILKGWNSFLVGLITKVERVEGNVRTSRAKRVVCKLTRRLFMQRTNGQLDVLSTFNRSLAVDTSPQATTPYLPTPLMVFHAGFDSYFIRRSRNFCLERNVSLFYARATACPLIPANTLCTRVTIINKSN